MRRYARTLLTGSIVALAIACGSKSNSGGQCSDFRGTYSGQLSCTNGAIEAADVTVAQSGCTLTVTDNTSGDSSTWAASGNKATQNLNEGGVAQVCEVTLNGNQFTQSCTDMIAGQTITCSGSGTRTSAPATGASGSGGSIFLGAGGGGPAGATAAGGSPGVGGTTAPQCGLTWSDDATCNSCMNTNCCGELQGCAAGTPCGNLLSCAVSKCPDFSGTCVQAQCSAELQAGSSGLQLLIECDDNICGGC
jgi:hypothetical protein